MIALLVFIAVVFLVALGFTWLADQPESLIVLRFGGFEYSEDNMAVIAAIAFALLLAIIFLWIVVTTIWKTPGSIGSFFTRRRKDKGWHAVADGMIAVGAGDTGMAKKAARMSQKYLPEEPVTKLLAAQSAQMEGKNDVARAAFEEMLEKPETKLVGLRGLYMEAENTGEGEAARHFVEQAMEARPGVEWSGKALLNMQAAEGDWEGALVTLSQNADSKLYTKKEAKRLRAVLLTAQAGALETSGDPQKAKDMALEAHRLAPELIPAAVIAARVLSRVNNLRKATKIVETTWKLAPHPELMDVYTHLRSGDSGLDRLKRAETLGNMRANHPESVMGVAQAQIDLQDWTAARKTLQGLVHTQPTERICLMMSEVEEGEFGDRGRMREWLSRAVRAPRDAAWTADGYVADEWAPLSPISGELDAFEWRVPVENLGEDADLAIEEIPSGPLELDAPVDAAVAAIPVIASTPKVAKASTSQAARGEVSEISGVEVIEVTLEPDAPEEVDDGGFKPDYPVETVTLDPIDKSAKPKAVKAAPAQKEAKREPKKTEPPKSEPKAIETKTAEPNPTAVEPEDDPKKAEAPANPEVSDGSAESPKADEAADGAPEKPELNTTAANSNETPAEAESTSSDDVVKDEVKDKEMAADPIDKPAIDDPGIKKETEQPRKRFRLF